MYIVKNALKCISRSKGRNVLIGIIALVIAISACIGLSIRQAAESAKASALEGMSVTGTISVNRSNIMNQIGGGKPNFSGGFDLGNFNRDEFENMMNGNDSLSLEEYLKYAEAESVQSFYYTLTAYFNGSGIDPVSNSTSSESSPNNSFSNMFPGMGGGTGGRGVSGDFSVVGYSRYEGMTDFINGTSSIIEGVNIKIDDTAYDCIISDELALYNSLTIGSKIVIANPSDETENYVITVVGIYSNTNSESTMAAFSASQDPANKIYISIGALQSILDESEAVSATSTNDYGMTVESKVHGTLEATYVFANTDDYYTFEDEVREMGLGENYSVSSTDIKAFENRLTPLNTLGKIAGVFLIVILIIGGVILVVLNIFNVRERKYEVGVLTAMGMKKWKVAAQFMCEILVVTMIAVIIGAGIGAVTSVPVTNALLEGQITSQSQQQSQINDNFKLPDGSSFPGGMGGGMPSGLPNMGGGGNRFDNMFSGAADYITEVNSAMNLTVVFQMIGVGLLLTLIASAASVMFIMRYDPLKILANRD